MLLAGFDGGQTSTRCRLSTWHDGVWQTLGEGRGPGVTHLAAAQGQQRFRDAIHKSFTEAKQACSSHAVAGAVIGASGIEEGSPLQQQGSALLSEVLQLDARQALATGDERTALRGAFPTGAGIVLISGTGMICLGRTDDGREHRCGGWGWLLDGGGSAFDLGHQGLQLCLRMADGRLADHPLRHQIWEAIGCKTTAEVKARVVQPDFGAAGFAGLAPLLVAAAQDGLPEAAAIVHHSAEALSASVTTVARTLGLPAPSLVGHGGALDHLQHFREAVRQAIGQRLPEARWCSARGDACHGALVLAREMAIRPR